jgi:hypothetical protein
MMNLSEKEEEEEYVSKDMNCSLKISTIDDNDNIKINNKEEGLAVDLSPMSKTNLPISGLSINTYVNEFEESNNTENIVNEEENNKLFIGQV